MTTLPPDQPNPSPQRSSSANGHSAKPAENHTPGLHRPAKSGMTQPLKTTQEKIAQERDAQLSESLHIIDDLLNTHTQSRIVSSIREILQNRRKSKPLGISIPEH